MNEVITAISNLGFPVAACVALGAYIYKRDTMHKAEIDKLADVVANNTKALDKIYEHIIIKERENNVNDNTTL